MKRRQFLRATAAAATLGAAGAVSASVGPYDAQPDHVTLDETLTDLALHRPLLDTTDVEDPISDPPLYGWRARSPRHETDVYVYMAYYPYQSGLSRADSHVPDREPLYVFVRDRTVVDRVVYDGWHYLAARDEDPRIVDATRPWLSVIAPWHPFRRPTVEEDPAAAIDPEVRRLSDVYRAWLDAGWQIDPEMLLNPWAIEQRGHWWADSVPARLRELYARGTLSAARAGLGLRAGEASDLV